MQHLSMTHTIAAIAGKTQAQNLSAESSEASAESPKAKFAEFLWPEGSDQDEKTTNTPVLKEEEPSTVSPDEATDSSGLSDVDLTTTSALPADSHDSSDDATRDDASLTRPQQPAVPDSPKGPLPSDHGRTDVPTPPVATAQAIGLRQNAPVNNQANTPVGARSADAAKHVDKEPSNPTLREMAILPDKASRSSDLETGTVLPDGRGTNPKDTFSDPAPKTQSAQQPLAQPVDLNQAGAQNPLARLQTPQVNLARSAGDTQGAAIARLARGIDSVETPLGGALVQPSQPKLETLGAVGAQVTNVPGPLNARAVMDSALQSQTGGRSGKADRSRIEKAAPDVMPSPSAPVLFSSRPMMVIQQPPLTAAPLNTDLNVERFPIETLPISELRLTGEPGAMRATPDNPMTRAEMPRHMAMQLADAALRGGAGRPIDLVLNPVELGRVKISLQTTDGTVVVQVSAERPETLDLMRRNAEVLAQEFLDIGYGEAQFSFSQQNSGDADPNQPFDQASDPSATSDGMTRSELPEAPTLTSIITDRVDIRV
ncbi:MAG: flagellar hook-length control protein FliK [Roseovarius sp.]|nr:flagellar hook-length control protein FliK [Roseovarius sp.]